MAEISLHVYLQQIDSLLDENRFSEAIAHCRHILNKFPRHVGTYRLYGKALLEQQKYDDAADIFRRVLSADPEDFISHVGLGVIHKEKGRVPESIWHLERAFEIEPYNGAIHNELRELYANRDGLRPKRINLTSGGLARLYFRGHLYQQAVAELRQLLENGVDRVDLQTLLAETLWRNDQRVDVVDVCLKILETLPDCIKANAILAEVWLVSGRTDEASEYLQRLRLLTWPEKAYLEADTVVSRAFEAANGLIDLPSQILVEELDYLPEAAELSGDADWVKEFEVSPETDEDAEWLDELAEIDLSLFEDDDDAEEDMLDWIRETAMAEEDLFGQPNKSEESQEPEEGDETAAGQEADTLIAPSPTLDSSEEDLGDAPEWLSEVTAAAESEIWNTAVEADSDSEASDEPDTTTVLGEKPDWILDDDDLENEDFDQSFLSSEESGQQRAEFDKETVGADASESDLPDWMLESSEEDTLPGWEPEPADQSTAGDEELPDWMTNAEEGDGLNEFPDFEVDETIYEASGDEIPDWLLGIDEDELNADEPSSPPADAEETAIILKPTENLEGTGYESEAGSLPAWMLADKELPTDEVEYEPDAIPEWLSDETEADNELEGEPSDNLTSAEIDNSGTEETADWLADFEEDESEDDDGLPGWINSSSDLEMGQEEINQEDVPDWLKGDNQEDMVREELVMGDSVDPEKNEPEIPDEDLDEAMKWLEELAVEQGADLDELPSMKKAEQSSEGADSAVEADEVPDWLKADLSEGDLSGEDDLPDWLKNEDASMTGDDWLSLPGEENLSGSDFASATTADDDVEAVALPSDDIPDWLKSQMPDDLDLKSSTPSDEGDELGWLEQIAAGEGEPLEEMPTLNWDEDEDEETGETAEEGLEIGDLASLEETTVSPTEPETEETDLPEYAYASETEEADDTALQVPDDPDEAIAWLEQLAAKQGAPLDELPTVVAATPSESDEEQPEEELVSEVDPEAETVFELPEAVDSDDVPEFEVPDDPDEAMAWLEALALQQGASPDEMTIVPEETETAEPEEVAIESIELSADLESEAPTVIDPPETVEAEEAADFEIPDDPDEAMAWLEQLALKQGAPLEELPSIDVISEMETPVTGFVPDDYESEPEIEVEAEADSDIEMVLAELDDVDMPEDDDEALAWLDALVGTIPQESLETAEEQESDEARLVVEESVDETVLEVSETVEESGLIEAEADAPTRFEALDEADDVEAEADDPTRIEMVEETTVVPEEPEEVSLFDEIEDVTEQLDELEPELEADDMSDALPDWLRFSSIGESDKTELEWLDTFEDSDVDSWLEAEDLVSSGHMAVPTPVSEPEPVAIEEPEAAVEAETVEIEAEIEEDDLLEVPEFESTGPLDPSVLEAARSALEIRDFDAALDNYQALLNEGQNMPLLIAELEAEAEKHVSVAGLQKLLGDAYMQNGQLQKAIDTYRHALDNL